MAHKLCSTQVKANDYTIEYLQYTLWRDSDPVKKVFVCVQHCVVGETTNKRYARKLMWTTKNAQIFFLSYLWILYACQDAIELPELIKIVFKSLCVFKWRNEI